MEIFAILSKEYLIWKQVYQKTPACQHVYYILANPSSIIRPHDFKELDRLHKITHISQVTTRLFSPNVKLLTYTNN